MKKYIAIIILVIIFVILLYKDNWQKISFSYGALNITFYKNDILENKINLPNEISKIEIVESKFDAKEAKEEIEMLINNEKTESYILKHKCKELVNYKEQYVFKKIPYKEKNSINIIETCQKAIDLDKNDFKSQLFLAIGYNKNQENDKSISILEQLADNNYEIAQRKLGLIYLYGELIEKDIKKANYWIYKAAENGDIASQKIIERKIFF